MSVLLRIVFDTSTLVSAALLIGSVPHRALTHALASMELCASAETLDELDRVLQRAKFDRYQLRELRLEFATMLRRNARLFDVSAAYEADLKPACRDPNDNKFLLLALACEADAIISSDADLLVMHPWQGVEILTPTSFVARQSA